MAARIQKSFDILMGVYFNGKFHMNIYEIDLYCNVETESIREQNIALERIKFFLNHCIESAILVEESKSNVIQDYINAGLKVCTLPEEPYDQIIGIMLMTKLNAIAEGRLLVCDISISSRLSDGVSCCHDISENIGPFYENGWWNESNTKINNNKHSKGKKVVKLSKPTIEWEEVYLDWGTTEPKLDEFNASEVVFVEFGTKNSNKS